MKSTRAHLQKGFRRIPGILGLLALILVLCAGCAKRPGSGASPAETPAGSTSQAEASSEAELSLITEVPQESSQAAPESSQAEPAESKQEDSQAASVESSHESSAPAESGAPEEELTVEKDGFYTSKEEVALYIHLYGRLPGNFISKRKAEELGWDPSEGNLDEVAPGKSIGGSRFGNYEGRLPKGDYRECDINYTGGFRGPERLIYSDDGRVYYTGDHYKTFEQLY